MSFSLVLCSKKLIGYQRRAADNGWTVIRINSQSIFRRSLRGHEIHQEANVSASAIVPFGRSIISSEKCKHPSWCSCSIFLFSIFFFCHLPAKNFSIFATLPPGCSRVSIFHFVERIERRWRRCTDHRERWTREREGEKKVRLEHAERCDEAVVYLYRRLYLPRYHYMDWRTLPGCWTSTHHGIHSAAEMRLLTGCRRI